MHVIFLRLGFPGGSDGKGSACNAGDLGLILGSGRSPEEGKTHFVVMDFRNVTRLFADPDWDGPIEIEEDFDPNKSRWILYRLSNQGSPRIL